MNGTLSIDRIVIRLVSGDWIDIDVTDPLSNMLGLLSEKRDRALTLQWGIWLTKYDPDRALKVCSPLISICVAILMCGLCEASYHHLPNKTAQDRR